MRIKGLRRLIRNEQAGAPNQGGIWVQAYSQRLSKLFAGGTLPEKTVD
jgi:hypothetical protein